MTWLVERKKSGKELGEKKILAETVIRHLPDPFHQASFLEQPFTFNQTKETQKKREKNGKEKTYEGPTND